MVALILKFEATVSGMEKRNVVEVSMLLVIISDNISHGAFSLGIGGIPVLFTS